MARFLLPAAALAAAVAVALARGTSTPWPWAALAGVNAATLLLYAYDKAVAGGRRTRVPENALQLCALLGGTPAAFAAQVLFRHKTSKASFRRVFWLIVLAQAALLAAALFAAHKGLPYGVRNS